MNFLNNIHFTSCLDKAVEQLHRHRMTVEEYDRWLGYEFPEIRLAIKSLKAEVIGSALSRSTPTIHDEGPFTVDTLREALRRRRADTRIGHYIKPGNIQKILHYLRQPFSKDEGEVRQARLDAAALLDPEGAQYRCATCMAWTSRALCPDCGTGGEPNAVKKTCDHFLGLDWGNPRHDLMASFVYASNTGDIHGVSEEFEWCPRCGEKVDVKLTKAHQW